MADEADHAAAYADRLNAEALENRPKQEGPSAVECIDCGDPIPAERRRAIRGCQTCFPCAEARERRL